MSKSAARLLAVLGVLAAAILLVPWPWTPPAVGAREIRVAARQYAYDPGVIHVPRGERVTLVLEAEDVTHGLYLDGYGLDVIAVPGRSARTTFVADRPGTFRFRCSQVCGTLHPFMLGELVVEPNTAFGRAALLAVLAAAATVTLLIARPPRVDAA